MTMNSPSDPARRWPLWLDVALALLLAAVSLGVYLGFSAATYRLGFPLDDAWIHQTYARNLGELGEWSFVAGQPSAGSTAPLWSAWLGIGYWLGELLHISLAPYFWTFLTGWLLLAGVGLAGGRFMQALLPEQVWIPRLAAALLILEWHLVWAAGSGMETLVSALIALWVLGSLANPNPHWLRLGLVIGLNVWVRPDGLTLLGPALLVLWFVEPDLLACVRAGSRLLAGFLCTFAPYLVFNYVLAGSWWPNTFYAKQAEYAAHQTFPIGQRYLSQLGLPLVGVGVLLLPGFLGLLWQAFRPRRWPVLAAAAWFLGYLLMYAWRLPVTYQHGRYILPAMPVYFILGLAGLGIWLRIDEASAWRRVFERGWALAVALVLAGFWLQGAQAYTRDVAVIETEMVAAAEWVNENTPPNALIAAHDIGALGYYARRPLLDLAGLVSPEVIPFIRDETRLAQYLDAQGAGYLVTFPGWYPELVAGREPLYSSRGSYSPALGGENMNVYRWP